MNEKVLQFYKKVDVPYASAKKDFLEQIRDGEWIITTENELHHIGEWEDSSQYDVKASFLVCGLAPHHSTDWLRFFCEEHHPEVDFDKDFETNEPGVFGRYQERFGYDYTDWANEKIYERLKEELGKKRYRLPWD